MNPAQAHSPEVRVGLGCALLTPRPQSTSHMKVILRNCVAVIVGLVLGGMINTALVAAGPKVFPPPAGVNMTNAKSLGAPA